MSEQLITCANDFALVIGVTAGLIFWTYVSRAIFDK